MDNKLKCPVVNCNSTFSRQYNLNRHFERFHNNNDLVEKCLLCGQICENIELLSEHFRVFHKTSKHFYKKESAFRKNLVVYRFDFSKDEYNFSLAQKKIVKNYF